MMEQPRIDWNRYFDAIYCINCITLKNRMLYMAQEFGRTGISGHKNLIIRETVPSAWHQVMINVLKANKLTDMQKPGEMSLAIGHYYCLTHALQNNYSRILILEDDVRFLKDLDLIQKILDSMPSDAELIHFDKFPTMKTAEEFTAYEKDHMVNDFYCEAVKDLNLLSTGCYSLSRSGMEKMHALYDKLWLCTDGYAKILDLKRYFPVDNLACQITFRKSMNTLNGRFMNTIHQRYIVDGLDYSRYNMIPMENNYSFGSYIDE